MNGPDCLSNPIVKKSFLTNGKPRHKCQGCGRQWVLKPQKSRISSEAKALIDK